MMKSYKEMSESVLKSINEHNIKKNTRKEILKRAIPLGCLCIALIGGGIFWNINGYHHSAPVNTNGENRVTITEDNDLMYASVAESNKTEPNNSSNQKEYVWICSRYENGTLYYRYTGFDNMEDYSAANAEARRKVLYSMSEKEREQWESRLDIENMFFYVDIATFTTFNEFRQALWERNSTDGEVHFDLYQNEEDCRNDKKLSFTTDRSFAEGMILKVYIAET